MSLLHGFSTPTAYRQGYVSIGNFDGVHRGHQSILKRLTTMARQHETSAVVITFEPHPATVLYPDRVPPQLTPIRQKADLLQQYGVDTVIAMEPTRHLLNLSPAEFFESVLVREVQARGLVEGPNFFFGKDRAGTIDTLRTLGQQFQVEIEIVDPLQNDQQLVSSTEIRRALRTGHLQHATEMLGRPYRIRGIVAGGARRGRHMGVPTANLEEIPMVLPAEGVYAGLVQLDDQPRAAAIHIGPNPTFAERTSKVEVHVLDYSGDLYGQLLDVDLIAHIRPIQQFPDTAALKTQLDLDLAQVRSICASHCPSLA